MPQKYRSDLSLYFTKFFVDDNHMKLLMDPGVVLEELGIKDEDSILSEMRSRYVFMPISRFKKKVVKLIA